ncbi:Rho termination factor N-terminal domain-containing protein [Nostoc sp. UHCC 0870]|uniref:Rho termination factor N-terminal domain-containing protein n=1 Tax=Nostoc sp. UHCC 0870 TaxID=2914041 RepID=UPI001EDF4B10|nr:Rho termination factor N-terminal domain-containing protein [Nostoc sp. UHCC 0870]UKP01517.1 Rho termination factor N-terminal domain-containing protein [Nostoc sp. UHCC 0870]
MSVSNVGNLMHISMDKISLDERTDAPEFLIKASAKLLIEAGGRNSIPVVVAEIEEDKYKVIGNSFVYAIAKEAQLQRVWCIVTDASERTFNLTKILAGESIPKINLSTATRDEIQSALQYLIEKPNSALKGVNLASATNRIEEAPRQNWTNLDPIIKMKCGITKGKKLDALKEVFYLTPESIPEGDTAEVVTDSDSSLKGLTITQLKDMAKRKGIPGYNKKKKQELITLLLAS